MDRDEIRKSPCGSLVPTINGAWAFVPDPLPPPLDLTSLISLISEASARFGELRGIGRTLNNPYLLIRPLQRKEAVASSSIEGTYTSLSDLFLLEAGADEESRPPDTREVLNYVRALEHSVSLLDELPVSLRMIREAHRILLSGLRKSRSSAAQPGEFRSDQNWIGGSPTDIHQARFVPPPHLEAVKAVGELEKFVQAPHPAQVPPLVQLALIHYQFETIHPFSDGNGRVGRLLIPLILCEWKEMDQPLLYLSPFFERHKEEYVDRLFNVSKYGEWLPWIEFFLRGVAESSHEAIVTVKKLQDLNAEYKNRIQQARVSALTVQLVDLVFEDPIMTIPQAQKLLDTTYPTAKGHVDRLVEAGVMREVGLSDLGVRSKFFVAHEIVAILNLPAESE